MTSPASATREYSTSWWVAEPPSMRPETEEVTLAPRPPMPPKSSSKWPDQ
ncbi:hypothetical protein GA0115236_10465 [Streptomyces sp. IgraMP-1]|nr:hypothetical protein GA0115236_10465 [Streptomyces sp. IgraMP-1]